MPMTTLEEFNFLNADAQFASLKSAYVTHPVLTAGWDKCMKTSIMPVKDIDPASVEDLRTLMRIMADRADELGCPLSAVYWRGEEKGTREMELPRSKWMTAFMS